MRVHQTALAHGNRERRVLERAVAIAEPVADDAVDDERAVHVSGGGKDLAARQVAPLFRGNQAARLDPLQVRIEIGANVAPGGVVARIVRACRTMS